MFGLFFNQMIVHMTQGGGVVFLPLKHALKQIKNQHMAIRNNQFACHGMLLKFFKL
jgi:hypothetical protein